MRNKRAFLGKKDRKVLQEVSVKHPESSIMKSIKTYLTAAVLIGLTATSCGQSDELTPDIVTIVDESITMPAEQQLTDSERDAIEAQRTALENAKANY